MKTTPTHPPTETNEAPVTVPHSSASADNTDYTPLQKQHNYTPTETVSDLLPKAIDFANLKHKGQLDDSGKDYFMTHICQVASILRLVTDDEDIIAAAYLHDTIEDTDTTYEELKEKFGQRVADLVNEVTHEGKKDDYGYYFPRLESRDAILIKFADRLSNLSRMQPWDEKRQQQYLNKSRFWKDGKSLRHLEKSL